MHFLNMLILLILRNGKLVLDSVQYFLTQFSQLLPSEHADEVYDEFRLYQNLPAIPPEIDPLQICNEEDGQSHIQADLLWHELEKLTDVNGKLKFGLLSKVLLPHSNADEERIFILVRKNKTAFRANLSLETTLPIINPRRACAGGLL